MCPRGLAESWHRPSHIASAPRRYRMSPFSVPRSLAKASRTAEAHFLYRAASQRRPVQQKPVFCTGQTCRCLACMTGLVFRTKSLSLPPRPRQSEFSTGAAQKTARHKEADSPARTESGTAIRQPQKPLEIARQKRRDKRQFKRDGPTCRVRQVQPYLPNRRRRKVVK